MQSQDIMPFVKSVNHVFSTMLGVHVATEAPRLKDPGGPCYDVSGVIGLSDDISGAIVLSFPADTAVRVVELFTGVRAEPDDPDAADAIGELVNMVTGAAKAELVGRQVSISCPSVIVGPGHRVFQQKGLPVIDIPCDCECGPFSVLVSMRETRAAAPAAA